MASMEMAANGYVPPLGESGCLGIPSFGGRGRRWLSFAVAGAVSVRSAPALRGERRFRLPLIVMPAGAREEYGMRYREDATPERTAARVKTAMDLLAEGKVEGMVIYCLGKEPGSEDLDEVAAVYRGFCEAHPPAQ